MDEPYQRPDRQAIAEQVRASLPGAANGDDAPADLVYRKKEQPAPDPVTCFTTHLQARMRALGWQQHDIEDRLRITAHIAAKAVNGTGVSLQLAGQLAALVGLTLPQMLGEYVCGTCEGTPPAGYACLECGTEGDRL